MSDIGRDDSGWGPPSSDVSSSVSPPQSAPAPPEAPPPVQQQAAMPPPVQQQAAMPPPTPLARGYSGMAIWAFVLGFLVPLGAFILGPIAISRINKSNGALRGKGLAIAGIVIGIAVVVIVVAASVAGNNTSNTGNSGNSLVLAHLSRLV